MASSDDKEISKISWIGDPIKIERNTRYFSSVQFDYYLPNAKNIKSQKFHVGSTALLRSDEDLPFVAEINAMYEERLPNSRTKKYMDVTWFYRLRDVVSIYPEAFENHPYLLKEVSPLPSEFTSSPRSGRPSSSSSSSNSSSNSKTNRSGVKTGGAGLAAGASTAKDKFSADLSNLTQRMRRALNDPLAPAHSEVFRSGHQDKKVSLSSICDRCFVLMWSRGTAKRVQASSSAAPHSVISGRKESGGGRNTGSSSPSRRRRASQSSSSGGSSLPSTYSVSSRVAGSSSSLALLAVESVVSKANVPAYLNRFLPQNTLYPPDIPYIHPKNNILVCRCHFDHEDEASAGSSSPSPPPPSRSARENNSINSNNQSNNNRSNKSNINNENNNKKKNKAGTGNSKNGGGMPPAAIGAGKAAGHTYEERKNGIKGKAGAGRTGKRTPEIASTPLSTSSTCASSATSSSSSSASDSVSDDSDRDIEGNGGINSDTYSDKIVDVGSKRSHSVATGRSLVPQRAAKKKMSFAAPSHATAEVDLAVQDEARSSVVAYSGIGGGGARKDSSRKGGFGQKGASRRTAVDSSCSASFLSSSSASAFSSSSTGVQRRRVHIITDEELVEFKNSTTFDDFPGAVFFDAASLPADEASPDGLCAASEVGRKGRREKEPEKGDKKGFHDEVDSLGRVGVENSTATESVNPLRPVFVARSLDAVKAPIDLQRVVLDAMSMTSRRIVLAEEERSAYSRSLTNSSSSSLLSLQRQPRPATSISASASPFGKPQSRALSPTDRSSTNSTDTDGTGRTAGAETQIAKAQAKVAESLALAPVVAAAQQKGKIAKRVNAIGKGGKKKPEKDFEDSGNKVLRIASNISESDGTSYRPDIDSTEEGRAGTGERGQERGLSASTIREEKRSSDAIKAPKAISRRKPGRPPQAGQLLRDVDATVGNRRRSIDEDRSRGGDRYKKDRAANESSGAKIDIRRSVGVSVVGGSSMGGRDSHDDDGSSRAAVEIAGVHVENAKSDTGVLKDWDMVNNPEVGEESPTLRYSLPSSPSNSITSPYFSNLAIENKTDDPAASAVAVAVAVENVDKGSSSTSGNCGNSDGALMQVSAPMTRVRRSFSIESARWVREQQLAVVKSVRGKGRGARELASLNPYFSSSSSEEDSGADEDDDEEKDEAAAVESTQEESERNTANTGDRTKKINEKNEFEARRSRKASEVTIQSDETKNENSSRIGDSAISASIAEPKEDTCVPVPIRVLEANAVTASTAQVQERSTERGKTNPNRRSDCTYSGSAGAKRPLYWDSSSLQGSSAGNVPGTVRVNLPDSSSSDSEDSNIHVGSDGGGVDGSSLRDAEERISFNPQLNRIYANTKSQKGRADVSGFNANEKLATDVEKKNEANDQVKMKKPRKVKENNDDRSKVVMQNVTSVLYLSSSSSSPASTSSHSADSGRDEASDGNESKNESGKNTISNGESSSSSTRLQENASSALNALKITRSDTSIAAGITNVTTALAPLKEEDSSAAIRLEENKNNGGEGVRALPDQLVAKEMKTFGVESNINGLECTTLSHKLEMADGADQNDGEVCLATISNALENGDGGDIRVVAVVSQSIPIEHCIDSDRKGALSVDVCGDSSAENSSNIETRIPDAADADIAISTGVGSEKSKATREQETQFAKRGKVSSLTTDSPEIEEAIPPQTSSTTFSAQITVAEDTADFLTSEGGGDSSKARAAGEQVGRKRGRPKSIDTVAHASSTSNSIADESCSSSRDVTEGKSPLKASENITIEPKISAVGARTVSTRLTSVSTSVTVTTGEVSVSPQLAQTTSVPGRTRAALSLVLHNSEGRGSGITAAEGIRLGKETKDEEDYDGDHPPRSPRTGRQYQTGVPRFSVTFSRTSNEEYEAWIRDPASLDPAILAQQNARKAENLKLATADRVWVPPVFEDDTNPAGDRANISAPVDEKGRSCPVFSSEAEFDKYLDDYLMRARTIVNVVQHKHLNRMAYYEKQLATADEFIDGEDGEIDEEDEAEDISARTDDKDNDIVMVGVAGKGATSSSCFPSQQQHRERQRLGQRLGRRNLSNGSVSYSRVCDMDITADDHPEVLDGSFVYLQCDFEDLLLEFLHRCHFNREEALSLLPVRYNIAGRCEGELAGCLRFWSSAEQHYAFNICKLHRWEMDLQRLGPVLSSKSSAQVLDYVQRFVRPGRELILGYEQIYNANILTMYGTEIGSAIIARISSRATEETSVSGFGASFAVGYGKSGAHTEEGGIGVYSSFNEAGSGSSNKSDATRSWTSWNEDVGGDRGFQVMTEAQQRKESNIQGASTAFLDKGVMTRRALQNEIVFHSDKISGASLHKGNAGTASGSSKQAADDGGSSIVSRANNKEIQNASRDFLRDIDADEVEATMDVSQRAARKREKSFSFLLKCRMSLDPFAFAQLMNVFLFVYGRTNTVSMPILVVRVRHILETSSPLSSSGSKNSYKQITDSADMPIQQETTGSAEPSPSTSLPAIIEETRATESSAGAATVPTISPKTATDPNRSLNEEVVCTLPGILIAQNDGATKFAGSNAAVLLGSQQDITVFADSVDENCRTEVVHRKPCIKEPMNETVQGASIAEEFLHFNTAGKQFPGEDGGDSGSNASCPAHDTTAAACAVLFSSRALNTGGDDNDIAITHSTDHSGKLEGNIDYKLVDQHGDPELLNTVGNLDDAARERNDEERRGMEELPVHALLQTALWKKTHDLAPAPPKIIFSTGLTQPIGNIDSSSKTSIDPGTLQGEDCSESRYSYEGLEEEDKKRREGEKFVTTASELWSEFVRGFIPRPIADALFHSAGNISEEREVA